MDYRLDNMFNRLYSRITDMYSIVYSFVYNLFVRKRWYIIEGNIGCGKSTLIQRLSEHNNWEVIQEPVEQWKTIQDESGENILGLFYKNSKKYAYLFQTIVFKTRMMSLEAPQKKPVRISERSIWTDKNVFTSSCIENGFMEQVEHSTYFTWFNWLESKIHKKPDGIIYLYATPEVCFNRVHQRNRSEEAGVPLDYLQTIHKKHEDWLQKKDYNGIPIYVIDNNGTKDRTYEETVRIIQKDTGVLNTIKRWVSVFFKNSDYKFRLD